MPDILIRGMGMPRSCFQCPLFSNCDACEGYECGCGLLGGIGYEEDISEDRRRDDCPLHELPPHGDLIDVSKIVLEYGGLAKISPYDFVGIAKYFAKQIEGQPVVVPSEREENDEIS